MSYAKEVLAAPVYGKSVAVELLVGMEDAQLDVHVSVAVMPITAASVGLMVDVTVPAAVMVVVSARSLSTVGVAIVAVTPGTVALNVTP